MIATGRPQILQYFYLLKNLPTSEMKFPKVEVKDFNGKIIESGTYHRLPKNSILQICAEFDIKIVVIANDIIEKKFFLKSENVVDVTNIKFGTEVKIFQGLDCIWSVYYEREPKSISQTDEELFLKLERGGGSKIKIPHVLGGVVDKLKNYPKVKVWLYKTIRTGFMNEESYLLFRQFILGAV